MANDNSNRLVLRGYPIGVSLFGLGAVGIAIWLVVTGINSNRNLVFVAIIPFLIGFALLGFAATIDTIVADRTTGIFSVTRRALLYNSHKDIPLSDIASVNVDSQTSYDSKTSRRSNTYQLQVVLKSGEVVPLETGYSSGRGSRELKAAQISSFIGVSATQVKASLGNSFAAALKMGEASVKQRYPGREGVSNGVNWRVETRAIGAYPAIRWMSADFKTPDGFLMLTQKASGSSINFGGGLLGGLGNMMQQQALRMYGFGPEEMPELATAQPVANLDSRLAQHYDVVSSNAVQAQQLLNPWVIQPLLAWAQQNPVTPVQSNEKIGPLLVLFSPSGVYACHFNAPPPGQENALPELGAELVKAQGGGQSSWS